MQTETPGEVGELDPRRTEVLLWEACRKYLELSGTQNRILAAFVFGFVANHPEIRVQLMKNLASQGIDIDPRIPRLFNMASDRRRFFAQFSE